MHLFEKFCTSLRHSPGLERMDWLWDKVRPGYNKFIEVLGQKGLRRNINGTDSILVLPRCRGVSETDEPEYWNHLMGALRPGDIVADVGTFIGLYTVAVAKRVGPHGRVVAFEPDPENFLVLADHVKLNSVSDRVELVQAAVGAEEGWAQFVSGKSCESHVATATYVTADKVRLVTLDQIFVDRRLDILKIDVEGYEREVLKGAERLLSGGQRPSPRLLYIEVHPYAWEGTKTTSESLLNLLAKSSYQVTSLKGDPIKKIESWGWVICRRGNA